MTSPETSEAEVEAAAHAIWAEIRRPMPSKLETNREYEHRIARAALTAAARVRAQEETVVLDSYAAENQRFHNHIERLQAALQSIISNDCWNNKIYSGNDDWSYGACAKIAQAALGIRKGE